MLDALARALRPAGVERLHPHDLASATQANWCMHAFGDAPAVVLAAAARYWPGAASGTLCSPDTSSPTALHIRGGARTPPHVVFQDAPRGLFVRRHKKARDVAGRLRLAASRHPEDPDLAALIGELTMKSPEFAAMSSEHKVRKRDFATYRMHHPLLGPMYPTPPIPQEPDQRIVVATAEADSPFQAALLPEEFAVATVVLVHVREDLLGAVALGEAGAHARERGHQVRGVAEEGDYPWPRPPGGVVKERSDWVLRFHLGDHGVRGRGVFDVHRGERWTGRVAGRLMRLPATAACVPVQVEVLRDCEPREIEYRRTSDPRPGSAAGSCRDPGWGPGQGREERWIRQIGRRRVTSLVSRHSRDADRVKERFGPFELRMRLLADDTELRWAPDGAALCLGRHRLRLPARLAPQASASARSEQDDGTGAPRFRLRVCIRAPLTGLLLSYTGYIEEYVDG
ncbi:DUF4166 domain-containing protein [Streptomyces sp. NPDC007901]|uniref:MmyB family transcriptional regulator n=1 Tax=Streptomyces sp. NPDC007901 TaxID=3364785 RepID=UPI0036E955BB